MPNIHLPSFSPVLFVLLRSGSAVPAVEVRFSQIAEPLDGGPVEIRHFTCTVEPEPVRRSAGAAAAMTAETVGEQRTRSGLYSGSIHKGG